LTTPSSQSAIGAVTGSETWNVSASADKADGIDAMKAASENRDAQRDGYGKVEELAGKAAGCEGMEKEGAESKQQQ
jgi:outer membrane cobalamin receptor